MKLYLKHAATAVAAVLLFCTSFSLNAQDKKVVIGISASKPSSVSSTYVNSVRRAGGVPLVIPITADEAELARILEVVDGVILTGGEDVEPQRYGEEPHPKLEEVYLERDDFDLTLARMTVSAGLPLLGICRGAQVMNVAFGGTLYQDIPSQLPEAYANHRVGASNVEAHKITVSEGTLLYQCVGNSTSVNSSHHQAVKKPAEGFVISAVSEDGVVEAIEMPGATFVVGVQFHPEGFVSKGDDTFLPIFKSLIESAAERK